MNFLKRLIEMAAPAPVTIVEALTADAIETTETTQATDAEDRRQEKLRLKEILTCDESAGRNTLAVHLATCTDLSPAQAQAILSTSPRELAAGVPKNSVNANFFEQHRAENHALWAPQPQLSVAERIAQIKNSYAVATDEKLS
jgi:hypothetical protein